MTNKTGICDGICDDWNDPEVTYADETEVCHHGIPNSAECEWCDEEEGEY